MLLYGMTLMVLSMVLLTVALNLKYVNGMQYLSIICVFAYIIGFAIGLGTVKPLLLPPPFVKTNVVCEDPFTPCNKLPVWKLI